MCSACAGSNPAVNVLLLRNHRHALADRIGLEGEAVAAHSLNHPHVHYRTLGVDLIYTHLQPLPYAKARIGKDDSEERRQQMSRHQQLKARQAELQSLLAKYGESDPEFIAKMEVCMQARTSLHVHLC